MIARGEGSSEYTSTHWPLFSVSSIDWEDTLVKAVFRQGFDVRLLFTYIQPEDSEMEKGGLARGGPASDNVLDVRESGSD